MEKVETEDFQHSVKNELKSSISDVMNCTKHFLSIGNPLECVLKTSTMFYIIVQSELEEICS